MQIIDDKPIGPAAAGIFSAALAFATLGALTVAAEEWSGFSDWLTFSDRVGELSGKTLIAAAVYFVFWILLAFVWRRFSPSLRRVVAVSVVLVGIGLVGTFPPFFHLFGD